MPAPVVVETAATYHQNEKQKVVVEVLDEKEIVVVEEDEADSISPDDPRRGHLLHASAPQQMRSKRTLRMTMMTTTGSFP